MAEISRRRKWPRRIALLLLLLVVVVPAAAGLLLVRTQPGMDFLLRAGLSQVPRWIHGEVSIGGLRSDGLLRGFTLSDVSIADTGGRPFIEVDSLRVEYSLGDLIRRNLVFVPVDLWRPRVVIETLHGEERSNLARIFGGEGEAPADSAEAEGPNAEAVEGEPGGAQGSGWRLELRRTAIHGGDFLLRLPVEGGGAGGRAVTATIEEGRGAGPYRLLGFQEIEARISAADLLEPGEVGQTIRFDQLAVVGRVFEEPFVVTGLSGDLVREGSGLALALDYLRTPGSEFSGDVRLDWGGPEGLEVDADLDVPSVAFEDFRWLEPRLPTGGGRMVLSVSGPLASTEWRVTEAELAAGGSRLRGRFGLDLGDPVRFSDTDLRAEPLRVRELDDWLSEPLPFEGELRGEMRAEGSIDRLRLDGDVSFADPEREIPPSTVTVEGFIGLGNTIEFSELSVVVDPLRYETLAAFLPDLAIAGEGRARVSATGALASAVQVSAEIEHRVENGVTSVLSLSGAVQRSDAGATVALAGTLTPLSLDGLAAALGRDLPVSGEVTASLLARGPISDLALSGSLETPGGPVEASVQLDVRDPLRTYRVESSLRDLRAHLFVAGLPDPTVVTGRLEIDGAGGTLETVRGRGSLALGPSRVGRAELDTVMAAVRAVDGRLIVDTIDVGSDALNVTGKGDLAMRADEPGGTLSVVWAADSLSALRPLVFGQEDIQPDTLTQLEREVLRADGVDPDTLVTADEMVLGGMAHGVATLRGSVRDFEGDGFAELANVSYGSTRATRVRADLRGGWHGSGDWSAESVLDFDSLSVGDFRLVRGSGGLSYGPKGGDFDLTMEGGGGEHYAATGVMARDSLGAEVGLRSLTMQDQEAQWSLAAPATVRFEGAAIRTEDLRFVESPTAADAAAVPTIAASGVLELDGTSALDVSFEAVELRRLGSFAQRDDFPSGVMDLTLHVEGPADAPRIQGEIGLSDPVFRGAALSRLDGTVEYADRLLRARLAGSREGQRLVEIDGRLPVDLSFHAVEDRFTEREMDVTIVANALPASAALAAVDAVEDVEGTLDGEIHLTGPRDDLRPTGEIRLTGGGITVPGLGLRANAVNARFRVRPDLAIEVEAEARSRGRAVVTGTVTLTDLLDPSFDLQLSASGFQAVERRDLTARVAGEMTLTGRYTEPRVGGQVRVEQGELFLEEFIRGAEVIDLTDPRFLDVVDTTLVSTRPVVAAQNPFMQNLRVDVALSLEQDFWIRSRERTQGMDVEIGGDLAVNFDRPARELVLVGTLEANRGSYSQFGRSFAVQSGTLEFPGTPGMDPSLDIQAVYRLRREGAEPLNIIANVAGTLQDPQVTLSSDAQPPIPESDLISYLLFGRPSYTLASREQALAGALSAGFSYGVSGLGATVGESLGLDYVSISQTEQSGVDAVKNWQNQFYQTQIEVGRYVGDDVFLSLAVRPLDSERRRQLPSIRLEWTFLNFWSMEGFIEDRLARQGTVSFSELDNNSRTTFGISLFREWGY